MLSYREKSISSFTFSLRYCKAHDYVQGYCKLLIEGTLGMADYAHPKWYYQFVKNFGIYL